MPNKQLQYIKQLKGINEKILDHSEKISLAVPATSNAAAPTDAVNPVTSLLHLIDLYNKGQRGRVEFELEQTIPQLFKAGLFDLFPPEDWIQGNNEGRELVGRLALEYIEANSWVDM